MSPGTSTDATRVDIRGEEVHLFAERAAYWVEASTLLVADPHFGKAATFRAAGIPVPRGTTTDGLARLDTLLTRMSVRRIVFLGDFLHAREGRAARTLAALREWRQRWHAVDMLVVRGNHDRHAGDLPAETGIPSVNAPIVEPPFVFAHHPGASDAGYVLAGHLHPSVDLTGAGRQHVRLPCFWLGSAGAVLPAFGDFTGLSTVTPLAGDRVFVIVGSEILEGRSNAKNAEN